MKKIGIGYENYKRIIDDGCYYIDKTLLIKDIIDMGGMVTLFTRPRRFGKTLALSMLRTFFELEYDRNGKVIDNRKYFEGKKIMDVSPDILEKMGKYPVIDLSLKSAKQPDFKTAFIKMRDDMVSEIRRHDYLLESDYLSEEEKIELKKMIRPLDVSLLRNEDTFEEERGRYSTALKLLCFLMNMMFRLKMHTTQGSMMRWSVLSVPYLNLH